MSHAGVVISNVTYEVSRMFSGSRSMKDLLKSQIMESDLAPLTAKNGSGYNGVDGSASKEV